MFIVWKMNVEVCLMSYFISPCPHILDFSCPNYKWPFGWSIKRGDKYHLGQKVVVIIIVSPKEQFPTKGKNTLCKQTNQITVIAFYWKYLSKAELWKKTKMLQIFKEKPNVSVHDLTVILFPSYSLGNLKPPKGLYLSVHKACLGKN